MRTSLLPAIALSLALVTALSGCPGEEPTPDAGEPIDSGTPDAGPTRALWASNDPVLSRAIYPYENLVTGVEHVPAIAFRTRADELSRQAFVITGLASGPDAGQLTFAATRSNEADVIYDVDLRTFTPAEADTVMAALGEASALPTALHDNGDGSLLAVGTIIRGDTEKYDLTFRQIAAPFDALESTLNTLSADGFAISAATAGEAISLIGARRRGATIAYEHRSAVASMIADAGLPDVAPTVSGFGPAGFGVSSLVARGDTVYVLGVRHAGEHALRVNTRRTAAAAAAPLESSEFGFDGFLLYDVEAVDGGYLMLGTK